MADIIKAISDAFEIYKKNWKSFFTAYLLLFFLGLIAGALGFLVDSFKNILCATNDPYQLAAFCIFPQLTNGVFDFIVSLLGIAVTLSVITPFYELAQGRKASDWASHFMPQLPNTLRVIVIRFLVGLVAFIPLAIILLINLSAIVALWKSNVDSTTIVISMFSIFLFLAISIILMLVFSFFLLFIENELVIARRGIADAVKASASLVWKNLLDVFIFGLVWTGIQLAVSLASLLLVCTIVLIPVIFLVKPFLLAPVYTASVLALWLQLKKIKPKAQAKPAAKPAKKAKKRR